MSANGPWTHTLAEPITLPTGERVEALKFPRMKGKYMRKFRLRVDRGDADGASSSGGTGSLTITWDDYMAIGAAMLADEHGPVTAGLIFDEMGPEDVTEVVGKLGERFAGGRMTGETA